MFQPYETLVYERDSAYFLCAFHAARRALVTYDDSGITSFADDDIERELTREIAPRVVLCLLAAPDDYCDDCLKAFVTSGMARAGMAYASFIARCARPDAWRHYHVTYGLAGGYLPDDVTSFTSLRYAREHAASIARDERYNGCKTTGAVSSGMVYVGDEYDRYRFVIEVAPCNSLDCYPLNDCY